MKKVTPETAEKEAIKQYLDLKNVFHFPLLAGLGSAKGLPDRIALDDGVVYGIEVKTNKNKQSSNQREFQKNWEKAGGIYLCGGLDAVMKQL